MTERTHPCDARDADQRLRDARQFLKVAREQHGQQQWKVALANAVLAGIAASDVICCVELRKRHRGEAHKEAVELLRSRDKEAATALERLLSSKTAAQYGVGSVAAGEATEGLRRAERLLVRAEAAGARPEG